MPVDEVVPPERAAEIAADVAPRCAVNLTGAPLETGARVLDADALRAVLDRPAPALSRDTWLSGGDPAYILFTSGSTGKPKGVPITAHNLANFHRGLLPWYGEAGGGVILNQISYSFDVSGCSLYTGLSRGMTLFTVDHAMVEDMGALFDHLARSGLTHWVSTPSFAELCSRSALFCEGTMPALRHFLFCGEVLTHKLCDTLAERFPAARVINTYGPTEATVLVTAAEITEEMRRDPRPIPIGRPIEEVRLRLVDADGRTVTGDGAPGELLILSDSVGPGYHGRPDLTEKSFFDDAATGKRGYRTGDLCYKQDGLYYYTGRADNQLKLNGFRVEIEDIESNLTLVDNVARAAVVPVWADGERSRVQYLAAFVLLEKPDGLTNLKRAIEIKKRAAEHLPAYMIPRKITAVDAFPLNTNGKIDRKALANLLEGTGKR